MRIRGQLEDYEVVFRQYGNSWAVIDIRVLRRKWYGLRYWKTVRTIDKNHKLETVQKMYPGDMLFRFTEVVKDYEDYVLAWKGFNAIQETGAKLEVDDT